MNSNKRKKLTYLLLGASCLLAIVLQLHNVRQHPIYRGFDADGHIEYIAYLKTHKKIPMPYEGWELYQQPLYYIIAALLPSLRDVKVLGLGFWLMLGLVVYYAIYKERKDRLLALLSICVLSTVPVVLYTSISISNEFLSTVLISLGLVYAAFFYNDSLKTKLYLGVVFGLAILTKATAVVLVFAFVISRWLIHNFKVRDTIQDVLVTLVVAFVVGGWVYLRNTIMFANPFVASVDFPQLYPTRQVVVKRNLSFFFSPKSLLRLDLFRAQHYSFLGGTLFSFFYDGHNVIVPVQPFSKAGVVLIIMTLPLIYLALIGFGKNLKKVKTTSKNILIMYSIILFISYVAYNIKLPFYSTVKGSFVSSLVFPYVYFLLEGMEKLKIKIHYLAFYMFLYTIILFKNFYILSKWY